MQSNEQLDLVNDFVEYTSRNIFLTGKAGTGKTTFLHGLKERSPKRMIVLAPTGVAAINSGGVTIHSFFQLSFAPQIGKESELSADQRFSKEKINIMRTLDLLIIDEVSMVRADILDAIDRTLRRFKNRKKAFGGTQVLMIGDIQQLSPVIKKDEWDLLRQEYDTPYFFSSKALKEFPYISIELTEVFRQHDNSFIELLNKIRENKLDDDAKAKLNQRYIPDFMPDDKEGYIRLCTHNESANRINNRKLEAIKGKTTDFKAIVDGKFPEYSFPTAFKLELKVGAQVMFIKNDSNQERRFFNGKIGKIQDIENNRVYILCPGEDEEIELEAQTWENYKYSIDKSSGEIIEDLEGSFTQIPLKLAWAITIHKSQGLTFDKAIIDAEESFAHGQVYVALSRCTSLEGLVLSSKISNRSIVSDLTVVGFVKSVGENPPGAKELKEANLAFEKEQLSDLLNFQFIENQLRNITRIVSENSGSFLKVIIDEFDSMLYLYQKEVSEVARVFEKQINALLQEEPHIARNTSLQERIKKASVYFNDKLQTIIEDKLKGIDIDIDNKTIKRQIKNNIKILREETAIKLASFETCKKGFDIKRIMDARAMDIVKGLKSGKHKPIEKYSVDYSNIHHPDLFKLLRDYRTEKSSELAKPAYMIYSQKVLYELSRYLPTDKKSLNQINGLGPKKIQQFGQDIIDIIESYILGNNIETGKLPVADKVQKKKKPKTDTRKQSLDLFNTGKSIEEIADIRGLTTGTIEGHLATYVRKGGLDISKLIDREKLKIICSWFEKAEDLSLSKAKSHFKDKFSYGELILALSYHESKDLLSD